MTRTVRSLVAASLLPLLAGSACVQWAPAARADWTIQGWSTAQTIAWYTASQGSRLVPQAWLDHLEQWNSTTPFLDAANIARYRYLPNPTKGWRAPDASCPFDPALPLGFTVDCRADDRLSITRLRWRTTQGDREPWVGLNCSACHTATLRYGGQTVRIEGGPTMADFQTMTAELEKALSVTASQPLKFARFANAVLGPDAPEPDRDMLRGALTSLNAWNASLARLNASDSHYGFGRLDAIGHIFNKAALLAQSPDAGQVGNPSDAPVSYPFLWNVPQLNKVEWNGLADNIPIANGVDAGALGRNAGEVVGVFGDVTVARPQGALGGYVSSIDMSALIRMDQQLASLRPPTWPASFPPLVASEVDHGRQLFTGLQCDQCHQVPKPGWHDGDRYTVQLTRVMAGGPASVPPSIRDWPVGTDMWMACNSALDQANSGAFKTAGFSLGGTAVAGAQAFNVSLVKNTVIAAIAEQKFTVLKTGAEGVFGIVRGLPLPRATGAILAQNFDAARQIRADACQHTPQPEMIVYKARPLQGIWATAPYLHNGSVVSLDELLLPPARRRAKFLTGTADFDPVHVGFVADDTGAGNTDTFDTSLPGNSNAGHDYGTDRLSPDDRRDLVEYLKSI